MKLIWLGHSAFRIEYKDTVLLVDPFLSGNEKYEGTVEDAAKDVTHVALTHGHDDHVGDTVEICTAHGAELVAIFEICMFLNGKGVENINPTNTGGTLKAGDLEITFVRADHSSGTFDEDGKAVYLGNPCGLIIKAGDEVIYHMGDTDIFSDMALINELYAPSIGLVPIGDRFTMGAKTAALACSRYFDFSAVIPCHYGSFPIIDPDASKFMEEMSALSQGQRVKVLEIGGELAF